MGGEKYTAIFSALRHPVRRRIISLVAEGPKTFTEIWREADILSSHFNHHLENLRGLVVMVFNKK